MERYTDEGAEWKQHRFIDLSAYNNMVIHVRWRFDTVDRQHNDFEGWYIDDVSLYDDQSIPDEPEIEPEPPYSPGYENTIYWSDESESGAVEYLCERSASPGFDIAETSGWTEALSHTYVDLQHDTLYYYRVRSRNVWGVPSYWSEVVVSTQDAVPPQIWCAGWWDTDLSRTHGGALTLMAYTPHEDVTSLEIYYMGEPTGVTLVDDGTMGDLTAGDGLYSIAAYANPGLQTATYKIDIIATDRAGNQGSAMVAVIPHS